MNWAAAEAIISPYLANYDRFDNTTLSHHAYTRAIQQLRPSADLSATQYLLMAGTSIPSNTSTLPKYDGLTRIYKVEADHEAVTFFFEQPHTICDRIRGAISFAAQESILIDTNSPTILLKKAFAAYFSYQGYNIMHPYHHIQQLNNDFIRFFSTDAFKNNEYLDDETLRFFFTIPEEDEIDYDEFYLSYNYAELTDRPTSARRMKHLNDQNTIKIIETIYESHGKWLDLSLPHFTRKYLMTNGWHSSSISSAEKKGILIKIAYGKFKLREDIHQNLLAMKGGT